MKKDTESILAPYIDRLVAERVEQLTAEGERLPTYIEHCAEIDKLITHASAVIEKEELDELISVVRGAEITIYEHIYRAGIKDGIWIAGEIERYKQRNR